jgi:hypothetical protein
VSGLSCAFRSSHAAVPDPEISSWVMDLTNNYCFYGNATSDMSACRGSLDFSDNEKHQRA